MPWQLFVSLRYLTAKKRERFISLITFISIAGVTIGVAALIIVIAVMTGFDNDLKDKIIGTYSHIEISSEYDIGPSKELLSKVLGTEHVAAASYFLNSQALIRSGDNVTGVIVKGLQLGGEDDVNKLRDYITEGSLVLNNDDAVIGSELAKRFRLKTGDTVTIVSPSNTDGKSFKVKGIFTSGMYEYDSNLVYTNLAASQELFSVKDTASGISVKIDDAMNADSVKKALQQKLGFPYSVRTWIDLNKNWLAALKLEKTVMFLILTLIVIVACFNIASALVMTVLEKTKDIGILKAIGATNFNIMLVFAMQGSITGIVGTGLGAGLGIFMCWLLKTYRFINLPKDIYYIDKLPVKLEMGDITLIVTASILLSIIATLYPSYRASRLDPVEALRYE